MRFRPWSPALLLIAGAVAHAEAPEIFTVPQEAKEWVQRTTALQSSTHGRLSALLKGIFAAPEKGGLGVVYDNDYTRTVAEVWRDRRANCLSMTAFFVACCRTLDIPCTYAEAINTNHWRRVGAVVQYERHVVALSMANGRDDLVADFLPNLRRRYGLYQVELIPPARFQALYHSNRAVEHLNAGDLEGALAAGRLSLVADPKSALGHNIMGVVLRTQGDLVKAEASFRQALALDARDGAAVGNLESLLRATGRDGEADHFRRIGEDVRRRDPYFHAFLADEAIQAGDLAEAAVRVKRALAILGKEPEFHLLDARVKLGQGNVEGAIKALEEARKWSNPADHERFDSKLNIIQNMKEGD